MAVGDGDSANAESRR